MLNTCNVLKIYIESRWCDLIEWNAKYLTYDVTQLDTHQIKSNLNAIQCNAIELHRLNVKWTSKLLNDFGCEHKHTKVMVKVQSYVPGFIPSDQFLALSGFFKGNPTRAWHALSGKIIDLCILFSSVDQLISVLRRKRRNRNMSEKSNSENYYITHGQ